LGAPHQIDSDLYHRQGKALTNFERTLPPHQSELARQLMKDPYNFEFLSFSDELLERDLERGLLEQLSALILELGKGFAFLGSQYPLEIGGQDYRLDLLFYHVKLHCYIVIELKIEEFKPEFAGKMNFYLSAVDDLLRQAGDQPTIGIILCRTHNAVIVEYALRDSQKPMGVAQYKLSKVLPARLKTALPTHAELSKDLPSMTLMQLRLAIDGQMRRIFNATTNEPMSILQAGRRIGHSLAAAEAERLIQMIQTVIAGSQRHAEEPQTTGTSEQDGHALLKILQALPPQP
jgi:predicted nuclease of restriction endonuclease-like (RecB) superfamily